MNKRGIFVFFICMFAFFLVGNAYAENETDENSTVIDQDVDVREAYDWLYEQMNESDWHKSPSEVALALLALKGKGYDVDEGLEELEDLQSGDNWGDIKSSALGTLAFYEYDKDVEDEIGWLIAQQEMAREDGLWYIQLATSYEGACRLNYNGVDHIFQVNGSNNEIVSDFCGTSSWIDFESCIKGDNAGLNETIDVNCVIGVKPSVIYNLDNSYYIVDQTDPLNIENGCFKDSGSCNCLVSGYAGWVLEEVGSDSLIRPYMKSSCSEDPVGNAFLYILTGEDLHKDWLSENQETDGSWDGDLISTYLSLLALKKHARLSNDVTSGAENFVKFWQNDDDGSWNGDVEHTAFILYILYGRDHIPGGHNGGGDGFCGDGSVEGIEECEYSYHCNVTEGYTCLNCECVLANATLPDGFCGDNICDPATETCTNCELDCGSCGGTEPIVCAEDEEFDPVTGLCKEKGSGWLKWLFIILAVILGVAIIYFVYIKFVKKKGGKGQPSLFGGPSKKPPFKMTKQKVPFSGGKPQQSSRPYAGRRDSKMEKELDDSLKKARELLKK
jgi:hypothetical protein